VNPFSVLVKPNISEKSNVQRETHRQYTFEVRLDASKKDVELALEKLYGVKPTQVNTSITRDKIRRRGNQVSLPGKYKKAVVTLPEGAKLPLFEE